MIIGNGLLARAFDLYTNNHNVIIFASGVSNSMEADPKQFAREFDMLMQHRGTKQKLIYFSMTSIYDTDLKESKYIKHKLTMEKSIINNFKNYNILRLPTVVGNTTNNHTFFNGIKNSILQGEVSVKDKAVRYLIDVDDLTKHLPTIIDTDYVGTVNTCFNNKNTARYIVSMMSEIMNKPYTEHVIEGGHDYSIDNEYFLSHIPADSVGLSKDYTYITLKKYLQSYDNILSS